LTIALQLVTIIAGLGTFSSVIYYIFCIWSAVNFLRKDDSPPSATPPVSILKPLKGTDREIYESFRSHCLQNYPQYEIIFGVSEPDDPAVAAVKSLQREFPNQSIQMVVCHEILGTNVKVSNLAQMLPHASYNILIINDSDIRVPREYLRRVVDPLSDPQIGMVTCLYRGVAAPTLGSRLEALGIATDFAPSVLVARQLEKGIRFGLGSTLAFRRVDLQRIGGLAAILDYLADDYELGKRIADLGLRVELSDLVVETFLPAYDLRGFFSHQLRWARGIRDARPAGYLGLIFTFGFFWSLVALLACRAPWTWAALVLTLALRIAVASMLGGTVLKDRRSLRHAWLIPFRDLLAVIVWFSSFFGHAVTWRGRRYLLHEGRLIPTPPEPP
jgi:ceramide glucosyltransferase